MTIVSVLVGVACVLVAASAQSSASFHDVLSPAPVQTMVLAASVSPKS